MPSIEKEALMNSKRFRNSETFGFGAAPLLAVLRVFMRAGYTPPQ